MRRPSMRSIVEGWLEPDERSGRKRMEFVVWIYQPLEQSQINQLLSTTMDLSVKYDDNSKEPKQPLSGKKAEVVLCGTMLSRVHPSMEYQRICRPKFLREPLLSRNVYLGGDAQSRTGTTRWGSDAHFPAEEEYEEIGISTLHIKGRLYHEEQKTCDTLKLFQWAAEEAGEKDKGFRTVVFASYREQQGKKGAAPVNLRKVILPRAFVVRYEEFYGEKDGMGTFEAIFQQSTAELMDCDKQVG